METKELKKLISELDIAEDCIYDNGKDMLITTYKIEQKIAASKLLIEGNIIKIYM